MPVLLDLAAGIPEGPWGTARMPVIVTSSNFGVGSLYAFSRSGDARHLAYGIPDAAVEAIRRLLGWGENVALVSHACVSAHLGLLLASQWLNAGMADRAMVFSFDFISPFVTGGFHALKILNSQMPEPYADRPTGSIGLGDGAAFAVLESVGTGLTISAQCVHNEMHHFTSNRPDGSGFAACLSAVAGASGGRRLWVKGHGTGTLEAGRLEARAVDQLFPGAPLVSWKGSLGHTLGSCGLVELAVAVESLRLGRVPGTVGSTAPCFTDAVATGAFSGSPFDGVVLASNAFGGAHAAFLLGHD
jgi:3-oxoacyl-(acyl-carrier-protein) synthase